MNLSGNKNTHNIVMYMSAPLTLTTTSSKQIVWSESSPGSPFTCRPVSLMLGKETDAALKIEYKKLISEQRETLKSNTLTVSCGDRNFKVQLNLKLTLIDGKMRSILSGLGGAFCILCTCTRDDAIVLEQQFDINRSGEQIKNIWIMLDSQQLKKRPHDQEVRMGVTQEPLASLEDVAILSPLHGMLRYFDFIMKIVYHLNAGIYNWSEEKNSW